MNRRQLIKSIGALAFPLPQTCQQAAEANQLTIGTLDPSARYMVIVRPDAGQDFSDWRKRREITGEIRDCFQFAGIERRNLGVVFLRGYSMDILQVGGAGEATDDEIALSLCDGESVTERLDQFGKACAAQRPELAETYSGLSWPVEETVSRILDANPEMGREQAFFQAVMEIAERAT